MKVSVKYTGPAFDYSGVGSATRSFICALDLVGVNVVAEVLSYSSNKENYFGEDSKLVEGLVGRNLAYDIKIVHVPGDSYLQHLEPCKYHIARLAWEVSHLPPESVWNLNLMDEIWTGSEHNKQAFERSGVNRPIWIFPETMDIRMYDKELPPWKILDFDGFLFFSIFQWIERKNPKALITAYLNEFSGEDKVGLLLKTYKEKFTNAEKNEIVAQILEWKAGVVKDSHPPIYLNVELMDKDDVFRIYETGDCFVLGHYGEGWCRPIAEALLYGKPVIATNLGGIHDHLTKECYLPLPYKEVNVSNMSHFIPLYREDGTQKWGEVDVMELRGKMRWVYEHREEAREVGKRGRSFVKSSFSYEAVGQAMKARLIDIQEHINQDRKKGVRWPRV